jgi:hypothetical protein
MRDQPPPSEVERLKSSSIQPSGLLLLTDTDIDRLGNYQTQWLAVTPNRLLVLSSGSGYEIQMELGFEEVREFRCQRVVDSSS